MTISSHAQPAVANNGVYKLKCLIKSPFPLANLMKILTTMLVLTDADRSNEYQRTADEHRVASI